MAEGGEPSQSQPPADAPAVPPPAPPPAPPIDWGPPAAPAAAMLVGRYVGGRPPFTIGRLLSDAFGRYGADPVRLFLVTVIPSLLSFGSSYLSNPFTNPQGAVRFGGLVGLVSVVVSILASATTFALLEGGPSLSFTRAVQRGFQRSGWFVLTAVVLGLIVFVVVLLVGLIVTILAIATRNPAIAFLLFLVMFLVVVWVVIRLSLAFAATVVDDLDTNHAVRVSWRMTGPAGIWLRIVGAGLVLGLLVGPASLGALVLQFPAMFGQLPLLVIPSAILLSAIAPLGSALTYSAYRRLVPPTFPPWAGMPATLPGEGAGAESIPPPAFSEPRFDLAAKEILLIVAILGVLGVALFTFGIGQLLSGAFQLPPFPRGLYPGSPTFPGFPGFTFPPFPTFRP